jgi:hypothetical protein
MEESNLWKAKVYNEEADEEFVFYFTASAEYEDALEVYKQIIKEYDYDSFLLEYLKNTRNMIYVGDADSLTKTGDKE